MTDDTSSHSEPGSTKPADDTFGWTEPDNGTGRSGQAREWINQLQAMIEQLAEQAAPVVREVGAKAAELAAIAGEKAGPYAQKAAEFTAGAGLKLAEKSRDLAAELRRDAEPTTSSEATDEAKTTEPTTPAGVA
jgi:hypothetical protein